MKQGLQADLIFSVLIFSHARIPGDRWEVGTGSCFWLPDMVMRTFPPSSQLRRCVHLVLFCYSTDTHEVDAVIHADVTPVHLKFEMLSVTHPQESMTLSLWQIQSVIKHVHVVPESSESLLSRVSSMSSSDISISSSRLMPISCSLCKFLISCKTHPKAGIRATKTGECMIYQVLVGERVHYKCYPLALRDT